MSIAPSRPIPCYPDPGESSTFEVDYDTFMAMPETKQHVEVVDGVIHVMAGATVRHQVVAMNLASELSLATRRERLGLVLMAPLDIIIRKRPKLRVRQPDVLFYSNTRAGFDTRANLDRVQTANHDGTLSPDLAIEVLSPGQNEVTLAEKLADYASILVDEVWFADQDARTIRVLAREGEGYRPAGEFGRGERVVSAVLPGLDLAVDAVFG